MIAHTEDNSLTLWLELVLNFAGKCMQDEGVLVYCNAIETQLIDKNKTHEHKLLNSNILYRPKTIYPMTELLSKPLAYGNFTYNLCLSNATRSGRNIYNTIANSTR